MKNYLKWITIHNLFTYIYTHTNTQSHLFGTVGFEHTFFVLIKGFKIDFFRNSKPTTEFERSAVIVCFQGIGWIRTGCLNFYFWRFWYNYKIPPKTIIKRWSCYRTLNDNSTTSRQIWNLVWYEWKMFLLNPLFSNCNHAYHLNDRRKRNGHPCCEPVIVVFRTRFAFNHTNTCLRLFSSIIHTYKLIVKTNVARENASHKR